MRDRTGALRRLVLKCPAGNEAQVYANPDRSRAAAKCGALLKRTLRGWREKHPSSPVTAHFADNELQQGCQQVARVDWCSDSGWANLT